MYRLLMARGRKKSQHSYLVTVMLHSIPTPVFQQTSWKYFKMTTTDHESIHEPFFEVDEYCKVTKFTNVLIVSLNNKTDIAQQWQGLSFTR